MRHSVIQNVVESFSRQHVAVEAHVDMSSSLASHPGCSALQIKTNFDLAHIHVIQSITELNTGMDFFDDLLLRGHSVLRCNDSIMRPMGTNVKNFLVALSPTPLDIP